MLRDYLGPVPASDQRRLASYSSSPDSRRLLGPLTTSHSSTRARERVSARGHSNQGDTNQYPTKLIISEATVAPSGC
ncbi:uncharacterized protein BDZ83DRAFT_373037 [Colletotrichum acutatum]|uniref:Uncharacterized protein n=1 Tax=Glomerella acutata TaxID=27357 RepID=A0AAD8XN77_GLOAC|nr:uncharacterized protein BDZ83DRAFT_373037 [Colletotrichum acutatum]KAK1730485.1 hypothetical protein BDZ83DRAFT_373037 [Colletotrichum acutatum]